MATLTLSNVVPDQIVALLKGEPVALVGSNIAIAMFGLTAVGNDYDAFVSNEFLLGKITGKALEQGFTQQDRDAKITRRWTHFGINHWHTNSVHFVSPDGDELNVVYKKVGGHPVQGVGQVLESFDFGHLAGGFDMKLGLFHDMRSFLFEDYFTQYVGRPFDPMGPLPLVPDKAETWKSGLISQYNGIREIGRYVKHWNYGFDMELVKQDLVVGYFEAAKYWANRPGTPLQMQEWQTQATIYETAAIKIDADDIVDLERAAKQIDYTDSLDKIMEALE